MATADVSPCPSPKIGGTAFRLPASTQQQPDGYSQHYVQKIRDLGQSSKESWITRLWNHMFGGKKGKDGEDNDTDEDNHKKTEGDPEQKVKGQVVHLPPIGQPSKSKSDQRQGKDSGRSSRDGSSSAPVLQPRTKVGMVGSGGRVHSLPAELANSPYISPAQKANYNFVPMPPNSREKRTQNVRDSVLKREAKSTEIYMKKPSHPYLSTHHDNWRPKVTRGEHLIQLEKKAKVIADKAMKVS